MKNLEEDPGKVSVHQVASHFPLLPSCMSPGRDRCQKQPSDAAKGHHVPCQKQADLAPEKVGDYLPHDLEGQRIRVTQSDKPGMRSDGK